MTEKERIIGFRDALAGFSFFVFYLLIAGIWQLYEELRFGGATEDPLHTMVAFLLAFLLAKDYRARLDRETP